MKALILNSGLGKRMGKLTNEHPKCMTPITESGETILSRQLKMLKKNNINDIVITTGLFDRVLINYCDSLELNMNIKFVNNPVYDKTNYIYSIYLAKDEVKDDIILMHGDLVFSEEVIKKVLFNKYSCMTVSSTKPLPEKDFKAVIQEKQILKVGIEFFNSVKAAQPLYKIYKEEWLKWLKNIEEFCENDNVKCYAENALNALNGNCKLYELDIKNELCEEIDNPEDLLKVCKMLTEK